MDSAGSTIVRDRSYGRRAVLTGVLVGLAGCMGDSDDSDEDAGDGDAPEATVTVGADGEPVFDPDSLDVDVGATVAFSWEVGGHSLLVQEQPEDGTWEGVGSVQDSGYTHRHTFEVEGRYGYECGPHADQGMTGEILVGEAEGSAGGGDDDDEPSPGGAYARSLPP